MMDVLPPQRDFLLPSPVLYNQKSSVPSPLPDEKVKALDGVRTTMNSSSTGVEAKFIDTVEEVQNACRALSCHWRVVIDLEGVNLCRDGRVCILQAASEDGKVYVFDITKLGIQAFHAGLGALLLDMRVVKLLYDARADMDALWHQFGVQIFPLIDLQVAHVSAFTPFSSFVPGLKSVLEKNAPWLGDEKRQEIAKLKQDGIKLFAPEYGGNYGVWDERPLRAELFEYACADVALLFGVCDHALNHLPRGQNTLQQLMVVSKQRSDAAILSVFPPKGRERARRDFFPVQGFSQ